MRIIISGSGGFLGNAFMGFCKKKGYPFLILKRNGKTTISELENQVVYFKSLLEEDLINNIKKFNPTVFVNFAWKDVGSNNRDSIDQFRNINLVLESVELAHLVGCSKWLGLGSQAEYGLKNHQINENEDCVPISNYGKAKLASSIAALRLCESLGIQGIWARVFSVYGENDHPNALIPTLINKMILNEEVNVTECNQIWDYLYIDDAIEAIHSLISKNVSGVYNLASGHDIILKKVVNLIKKETKSNSIINFGAVPFSENSVRQLSADNSKINQKTNWQSETSLEEGIKKTVSYYLKNK
ncbi:MAG: NAD(P)-dependent oxidoreductase [bacterium]|nr:NAD(P)-dependent oxidoreductase [bacterium]